MPIYVSKSRIEQRHTCEQLRYWQYDHDGRGLVPEQGSPEMTFGVRLHDMLADVLMGDSFEAVFNKHKPLFNEDLLKANLPFTTFSFNEQWALLEGLTAGWARVRLPSLLTQYEPIVIEEDMEFVLAEETSPGADDAVILRFRPDFILRNKDTHALRIDDFKSLKMWSYDWEKAFTQSLQTSLYIHAVTAFGKGAPVEGMVYHGLSKGWLKKDTAKSSPWYGQTIQFSPLCYGWMNQATKTLIPDYQPGAKGFIRAARWETVPTLEWLDKLGEKQLRELFPTAGPFNPPTEVIDEVVRNVVHFERQWTRRVQAKDRFEKNTSACFKYGNARPCAFYNLCWGSNEAFHGFRPKGERA